jgi:hypothetical protein
MNLRNRLRRLERDVEIGGCPACRDRRGRTVPIWVEEQPDGTMLKQGEWPTPCQRCGEVPEVAHEITEIVVDSREELERLDALEAAATRAGVAP